MRIAFNTLGCKLNFAETSTYERGFREAGLEVVPWGQVADLYLVNTCSVTEHSNQKARGVIRRAHRTAPDAAIIVTGCYAQLRPEEVKALDGVALVFGADRKSQLVSDTLDFIRTISHPVAQDCSSPDRLAALRPHPEGSPLLRSRGREGVHSEHFDAHDPSSRALARRQHGSGDDSPRHQDGNEVQPLRTKDIMGAFSTGERTRAFLKVQDGCSNYCAYCTVPYARGESRSMRICEVVKAAEEIAKKGVKEIVITGVNTGDFGRDTGESFLDLLKALNNIEGIERYRISSIEPNLITDEIVDWIASGTKIVPHFHIPLQTGSDILLKKMGRKYDTAFFEKKIAYIRERLEAPGKPKVFFGIDTMVGLPGETEELFMETYEFISRIRPAFIHIFPYSKRPGTRAAVMPGQIPERIKTERVARLEALCEGLHNAFVKENRGIAEKVIFESKEKDGSMSGYTGNYIKITRPYDKSLVGKLTDITI